jgi:hypothetical protein
MKTDGANVLLAFIFSLPAQKQNCEVNNTPTLPCGKNKKESKMFTDEQRLGDSRNPAYDDYTNNEYDNICREIGFFFTDLDTIIEECVRRYDKWEAVDTLLVSIMYTHPEIDTSLYVEIEELSDMVEFVKWHNIEKDIVNAFERMYYKKWCDETWERS